jgi:hypothetical protein
LPCRHMYSILKRKPLPCDLILRYHTNFHYFYQKQKYLDIADCYNNILCDTVKGPIVEAGKLDVIPISQVIPDAVIAALPGNIPILHKNCKWNEQTNALDELPDVPAIDDDDDDDDDDDEIQLHVPYQGTRAFSQDVMLSQQVMDEEVKSTVNNATVNNATVNNENDPSLELGQGRKRNYDVYGDFNPLYQDVLKFAEVDQEEYTKLHQAMRDMLAQSLQRQAMKKGPRVTSNTISSSLEIENKRVYKRKKPLGERGNKK